VQTVDYIDSIKAFFFSDNRQLKSFTEPDPSLMHRQEAFNGGERRREGEGNKSEIKTREHVVRCDVIPAAKIQCLRVFILNEIKVETFLIHIPAFLFITKK